ncbi:hypothetical protein, conserved [Babesia bigemina]|uniref:protein-histidine N-methyltransferase n=1 Tax=Babesia bigemina TaxID=5866 RepID=A0A061D9J7_BABBI|nr:hypothetical protein, conserved [Babesia bigemina]CDR95599.1 hypothetical protein, conserved [Babesia bigemina]|eukprot:XP_012767785.1 hypothetical protein, conserved [Babesia bigemina]
METRVNYSLQSLLNSCQRYSVDVATCRVSTVDPKADATSGDGPASHPASNHGSSLTIRVAALPTEKQSATVKRRKYEGGFTIWESTWFLAAFLHEEMKTRSGGYAIDLGRPLRNVASLVSGCGNGICGIIGTQHRYKVLFQDLNWDVLEESVIPNCILNATSIYGTVSAGRGQKQGPRGQQAGSPPYRNSSAAVTRNEGATTEEGKNEGAARKAGPEKDDPPSTETDGGNGETDFGGKLDVEKGSNYHFGTFIGDSLHGTSVSKEAHAVPLTDDRRHELEFELIACCWEDMADLCTGVLAARKAACDIIFASECLYRTESYPAIAAVLRSFLRPAHGVAFIATKRFYFGLDGGTFEFITFINGTSEGAPPDLKASIRKSHTPHGSTNVIDIIEVRMTGDHS